VAREHYHFLCPGLFAAVKNHICNKFTVPEINSKHISYDGIAHHFSTDLWVLKDFNN